MSVLDPKLIEKIARQFGTTPGLIEKDWNVVRAIRVLASQDYGSIRPVFSGGTSLSKGWGLIKRFSEDVDFKVQMQPGASGAEERNQRRSFRERVFRILADQGFELAGKPLSGNASRHFMAHLAYPCHYPVVEGLRPHLRIEMSFYPPALEPEDRPIRSLLAQVQGKPAEVAAFPCVHPIETAADKLSALAWRVCSRQRGSAGDDPSIVRHLHDLAALENRVGNAPEFADLVWKVMEDDRKRGSEVVPQDPQVRLDRMLEIIRQDNEWANEYDTFVLHASYASAQERISFAEAIGATERLVGNVVFLDEDAPGIR